MTPFPTGDALARAAALIDIGRCADALPLIHQAIAQDPQDERGRGLLSLALLREHRYKEAEEAARAAIGVAPESGWGYSLRALALVALERREVAVVSAQRAVDLEPANPDRYNVYVQVALGWRTDRAQKMSEVLLRLAPQSAVAHYRAGTVAMYNEQLENAEACFRRALELDPVFAPAHNDLGVVLLRQGRRREALDAFQRAIALAPTDQAAANNIRVVGRQHKLPVPRWARRPILMIPGLVVALGRRVLNRHELDGLPHAARREVTRWTRTDVKRLALLAGVGGVTVLFVGWQVAGMVNGFLHPTATPSTQSTLQAPTALQQPTNKQLVCDLAQAASLMGTLAGSDSVDTTTMAQQLGTDAYQTARLVDPVGRESNDITAIGTDAATLATDLQAHPASNVAGSVANLQADATALTTDAGC